MDSATFWAAWALFIGTRPPNTNKDMSSLDSWLKSFLARQHGTLSYFSYFISIIFTRIASFAFRIFIFLFFFSVYARSSKCPKLWRSPRRMFQIKICYLWLKVSNWRVLLNLRPRKRVIEPRETLKWNENAIKVFKPSNFLWKVWQSESDMWCKKKYFAGNILKSVKVFQSLSGSA